MLFFTGEMFYLVLAILCSGGNALILKFNGRKSDNKVSILLINYVVAVLFGTILMRSHLFDLIGSAESNVWLLSIVNGAIYVTAFIIMQLNIIRNGATVTGSMAHIGLVIPLLFSFLLFGDQPTELQIVGVAISVASLLIISIPSTKIAASKYRWMLALTVILGGVADSTSKFFEYYCNHKYEDFFLWVTFLVALILCFIVYKVKDEHINRSDFFCGAFLGVVNYLSTKLLIRGMYEVPSYMAYIIFGLGTIVFINLANLIFMHERLSRRDYMGMALAMLSIAILNL